MTEQGGQTPDQQGEVTQPQGRPPPEWERPEGPAPPLGQPPPDWPQPWGAAPQPQAPPPWPQGAAPAPHAPSGWPQGADPAPHAPPAWPQPGAAPAQHQPPAGWYQQHPPSAWPPQSAAPIANYAYPPRPPARKEPAIAVLISFFVPGVGHLYAGDTNTGSLLLALYLGIIILDFILAITIIGILLFVLTIPASLAVWIYAMVDSYAKANAYNRSWGLP